MSDRGAAQEPTWLEDMSAVPIRAVQDESVQEPQEGVPPTPGPAGAVSAKKEKEGFMARRRRQKKDRQEAANAKPATILQDYSPTPTFDSALAVKKGDSVVRGHPTPLRLHCTVCFR